MPINVITGYEVIVVGGGTAGIGAAIAAARNGSKTLLIESSGYLGGEMSTGLAFLTFHALNGEQAIWGLPQEFVDQAWAIEGTTGHLDVDELTGHIRTVTYIDPEVFKVLAIQLVSGAGAEIFFHSLATDVILDGPQIRGVVVENKSGRQIIMAKVIIDATGDGDIAAYAGAPYEKGRPGDQRMMAMTLMFRMGNVDLNRVFQGIKGGMTLGRNPGESVPSYIRAQGTFEPWAEVIEREGLFPDGAKHLIAINTLWDGQCNVNTSRIIGLDGTSALDLSRAEVEARVQVMRIAKFLKKYVPGFEKSHIITTASRVGKRETRRIIGEYVLTKEDCLTCRPFDDVIARGCYPFDLHDPDGKGIFFQLLAGGGSYEIPYRCLVPKKVENLLVVGRCMSVTHEALASTRVMATGMACGQAAGTAASLAVQGETTVRKIDMKALQNLLVKQGAYLGKRWPLQYRMEGEHALNTGHLRPYEKRLRGEGHVVGDARN